LIHTCQDHKCLQLQEEGDEAHFHQCVFRANEEYSQQSVFAKGFVCDQMLSQKLGARQKRAARAKNTKADFTSLLTF